MTNNYHSKSQCQYDTLLMPQAITYATPSVGLSLLTGSLALLPVIYAKYYGLTLTTIATVMLVARIFDAITDPLIAHYSDLYQRKYGTRKPFILLGGLGCTVCIYFLCVPVGGVTITYFTL